MFNFFFEIFTGRCSKHRDTYLTWENIYSDMPMDVCGHNVCQKCQKEEL